MLPKTITTKSPGLRKAGCATLEGAQQVISKLIEEYNHLRYLRYKAQEKSDFKKEFHKYRCIFTNYFETEAFEKQLHQLSKAILEVSGIALAHLEERHQQLTIRRHSKYEPKKYVRHFQLCYNLVGDECKIYNLNHSN